MMIFEDVLNLPKKKANPISTDDVINDSGNSGSELGVTLDYYV